MWGQQRLEGGSGGLVFGGLPDHPNSGAGLVLSQLMLPGWILLSSPGPGALSALSKLPPAGRWGKKSLPCAGTAAGAPGEPCGHRHCLHWHFLFHLTILNLQPCP